MSTMAAEQSAGRAEGKSSSNFVNPEVWIIVVVELL